MSVVAGFVQPVKFQRAMVFIDGTNLFHRLEAAKVKLTRDIQHFIPSYLGGRQPVRGYLYTVQEHLDRAMAVHGTHVTTGLRVKLGEGVPTPSGIKEKGVDALLVADLVYHAAVRTIDYALVVSCDTDFVEALRRVEDFGCRTAVLAVGCEIPERLRDNCDEAFSLPIPAMVSQDIVAPL